MVTREDVWEIKALLSKILEKCDEVQEKFRASLDYLESSVEETGFEDPGINNENQEYNLQLGSEEATNAEPDDSAPNRECSEILVRTKPSANKIIDCEDADMENGVANEKLQMECAQSIDVESSYWANSKECSDKVVVSKNHSISNSHHSLLPPFSIIPSYSVKCIPSHWSYKATMTGIWDPGGIILEAKLLFFGSNNPLSLFSSVSILENTTCVERGMNYMSDEMVHWDCLSKVFDKTSDPCRVSQMVIAFVIDDGIKIVWVVFDKMPQQDPMTWNETIEGYTNYKKLKNALYWAHKRVVEAICDIILVLFVHSRTCSYHGRIIQESKIRCHFHIDISVRCFSFDFFLMQLIGFQVLRNRHRVVMQLIVHRNNVFYDSKFEIQKMSSGNNVYEHAFDELLELRQRSTVGEYRKQFLVLANRIEGLLEILLISCFVCGLEEEIRAGLQLFQPYTLEQAMGLAMLQEMTIKVTIKEDFGGSSAPFVHQIDRPTRTSCDGKFFIKNFSTSFSAVRFKKFFCKFGTLHSCKVTQEQGKEGKCVGLVQDSSILACNAILGTVLERKKLRVCKFVKKSERENANEETKFTNLCVKNLGGDMTEDILHKKFSAFVKVRNVLITRDAEGKAKGFGSVNFILHDEAKKAMETLNGALLGTHTLLFGRAYKNTNIREAKKVIQEQDQKLVVKNKNVAAALKAQAAMLTSVESPIVKFQYQEPEAMVEDQEVEMQCSECNRTMEVMFHLSLREKIASESMLMLENFTNRSSGFLSFAKGPGRSPAMKDRTMKVHKKIGQQKFFIRQNRDGAMDVCVYKIWDPGRIIPQYDIGFMPLVGYCYYDPNGIVAARDDLGVEILLEQIPTVPKKMIHLGVEILLEQIPAVPKKLIQVWRQLNKSMIIAYKQRSVQFKVTFKLSPRFYGSYIVLQKIGAVACKLALPPSSRIHPVFHVSLFKQKLGHHVVPQSLLLAVTKAGTLEPVPLAILDRRLVKFKGKPATQLLIPWTNSFPEEATWELYHSFKAKFPLYMHKKGLLFPNASRFPCVVDGAYLYAYTAFNELITLLVFVEMMLVCHLVVAGVARSRVSLPFGIMGSRLICAALYCGVCLVMAVIINIGAAAELTTTILFTRFFFNLEDKVV